MMFLCLDKEKGIHISISEFQNALPKAKYKFRYFLINYSQSRFSYCFMCYYEGNIGCSVVTA